ncbi:MAG TPA: thioesterase family protein [Kofleriaceae bacterium]|nr:thioesterase family protein [Kofleriaceae bacterium]
MTTDARSFADASAVRATDGPFAYAWEVPDGWQQGRGAYGGLVLGALVRAAEASEADRARRVRVVTGELCAPVLPGAATIAVAHVRRGSGVTYADARVVQGAEVVARASVLLAGDRKVPTPAIERAAPALPPAAAMAVAPPPSPPAPPFTRHVDFRPTGPLPFSGAAEASTRASGYVSMRVPLAAIDAPAMVALLDAWWPAVLAAMPAPRPMATVSYTADLLADPAGVDPAAPLAYTARTEAAAGGFVVELRELWQDGRLLALNQQTFAIIA